MNFLINAILEARENLQDDDWALISVAVREQLKKKPPNDRIAEFYVKSGFKSLDHIICGFPRAGITVIRSNNNSDGVTSLMLNCLSHAVERGERVGYVQEMTSYEKFFERLVSMHARVPIQRLREGEVNRDELRRLIEGTLHILKMVDTVVVASDPRSDDLDQCSVIFFDKTLYGAMERESSEITDVVQRHRDKACIYSDFYCITSGISDLEFSITRRFCPRYQTTDGATHVVVSKNSTGKTGDCYLVFDQSCGRFFDIK